MSGLGRDEATRALSCWHSRQSARRPSRTRGSRLKASKGKSRLHLLHVLLVGGSGIGSGIAPTTDATGKPFAYGARPGTIGIGPREGPSRGRTSQTVRSWPSRNASPMGPTWDRSSFPWAVLSGLLRFGPAFGNPGELTCLQPIWLCRKRRGWDSNPRSAHDSGFQDRCDRPLCHPSPDREKKIALRAC